LGVQVKYGEGYLQQKNKWGYVYRGELKHFNYFANYPIPVIIAICDPSSKNCYWAHFRVMDAQVTENGWTMTVPFKNVLASSKADLESLVPPTKDALNDLQAYWRLNKILSGVDSILFAIERSEIESGDTSEVRFFFNRLRATRELAYECRGKVILSVSGYDDDPRDLFEVGEVKQYIAALDSFLPDLFFFIQVEPIPDTIRLFAYCLADGRWTKVGPNSEEKIALNTSELKDFIERHLEGLHEIARSLDMSDEEVEKIAEELAHGLGLPTN
jgi:hypothetical protein